MAILIMGKYAISKLSIILHHISKNLSIGFIKIFSEVAKKPSADEAEGLNFAILNTRSIK